MIIIIIVQFQKISILPPQKGLEFPGGEGWGVGSVQPTNLKKYMKLNWKFQKGGRVLKNLFCGAVWIFSETTYLLLTEFEVRTVSYGPSFFPFDLWPTRVINRRE